jgi:hypothetical protein
MTNTRNYSVWLEEKRHGFYLISSDLSIAISANLAMSRSMPLFCLYNEMTWPPSTACTFETTRSFTAVPLQAAPPRLSMFRSV